MATTPKSISGLTSASAARVVLWQSREFITVPGDAMGLQPLNAGLTQLSDLGTINLFGGQITFPATQNPSSNANTLDDYEEGTWTGVATSSVGAFTTVAVNEESYTKIGNRVTVSFLVNITTKGTAAGTLLVSGLPFTIATSTVGACRELLVVGSMGWVLAAAGGTVAHVARYDNATLIGDGYGISCQVSYRV